MAANVWRVIDGVTTAWFEAASSVEGAALAARVVDRSPGAAVDVRPAGVRVRLDAAGDADADAVAAAAHELGLVAEPARLQHLRLVVESAGPDAVRPFWQRVLGYEAADDLLVDPLRRDLELAVRSSSEVRPLRDRLHVDVSRPAAVVDGIGLGEPFGPYGVCHVDADGNEVDVVPGDGLGEGAATADWSTVFGAVACYRTTSPAQQAQLASAAAASADDKGFPLLIDLRPGVVILDSGKDQWEAEAHGLDVAFVDLAAELQVAARALGAVADPTLPHFVQVGIDAADVDAVRAWWLAALGYVGDRRDGLTDIVDPCRLGTVLMFQTIDVTDTARRAQRNRLHLELTVGPDVARLRVAAAVAAGGHVLEETTDRWRLADPEGNELVIVTGG